MQETKKTIDKKKLIVYVIGIILVLAVGTCFALALNNHSSNTSSSSKNSKTSSAATITKGGTYDITGEDSCVTVNTTDSVELVLENAKLSCDNGPAINIEEAKDVNIILKGDSTITSTTTEDLDGAIYSKADLTFSGDGKVTITSNYDGIVSKDTLVIKSGTYEVNATDDGIRGKDSVEITGGEFTITSGADAIKSTNDEDTEKGTINITGGTFTIKTTGNTENDSAKGIKATTSITIDGGEFNIDTADDAIHSDGNITINNGNITITSKDDGIHANGLLEVNNGTLNITASEGLEATYVKINDGTINVSASDDGINAANKSDAYSVKVEINGGDITIKMGQGDTDGIDSNGDLYITGGTINITGQSPFDYDGTAKKTGGTIIVNGTETDQITNQMMGGPGGNMGGEQPANGEDPSARGANPGPRGNQGYRMR